MKGPEPKWYGQQAKASSHTKGTNHEESHKRNFSGTWASKFLHELVEAGTISAKAGWLAMDIVSLSPDGKPGCYASNAYLAKIMHTKERQIQRLLLELAKAGILDTHFIGTTRYMKIHEVTNSKSSSRRTNYLSKSRKTKDSRCVKNDVSRGSRCVKNDASDASKMTHIYTVSSNEDTVIEDNPRGVPRSGDLDPVFPPGKSPSDKSSRYAKVLYKALSKAGRVPSNTNVKLWPSEFRKLLDGFPENKVKEILGWYCTNLDTKYVPIANSAKSFREKFVGISLAMKRQEDNSDFEVVS